MKFKAHSLAQRTLKIDRTDTGIILENKDNYHGIYPIAFG
jgi:hypothetical protein